MFYLSMGTRIHYEDCRKARALVKEFAREIDYKNGKVLELERKLQLKDRLLQAYNEVLGVCDISFIEEANDMLKCEVEVMAKEIQKQMEVLEETKYKSILERRDLLAKNEKLKNDLESQKKLFGRLGKKLEDQGYDLMTREDLMNNEEKMPLRREGQINKQIKMLQEKEDKHLLPLENTSIMSKKQKVEDLSFNGSDNSYASIKESEEKLRKDLESSESPNKTPMIMGCMSTCELQDAHKEVMKKYTAEDWEEQSDKLISHWEDCFQDVHWHPFKRINHEWETTGNNRRK